MGDIPEQQVIALLLEVLENHKRNFGTMVSGDAMDIEPTNMSIPSLATFLPMVLRYQMSSTAACYALKTSLSNVDDIIVILQELDHTLEKVFEGDFASSAVDLPPLPSLQSVCFSLRNGELHLRNSLQILSFTQFILDAHLLTLLQHLSARPLLRQISDRLQSNIITLRDFSRLQGPLSSVLQVEGPTRTLGQRENKKDKRKDAYNAVVGLYQVEELVL